MQPAADKIQTISETEWFYLKLSFVLVALPIAVIMVYGGSGCPFPTGICQLYSFNPLFTGFGRPLMVFTFLALSLMYILEKQMLFTTFLLSLLSCIVISHHESNGVFFRATIISMAWIGQFIAYLHYRLNEAFDIRKYRVQYVIQMIAATYTLAGIAKLHGAGLNWINSGETFPLQVMKNYAFLYFDGGNKTVWDEGCNTAYFLLHHHLLVKSFLTISLALEFFCFAALLGKRTRIIWGIGLLLMHFGIAFVMGIGISVIAQPMVVFFLNPLYYLRVVIVYVKHKFFRPSPSLS